MRCRPDPSGRATHAWNPMVNSPAQFHSTWPVGDQAGPQSSWGSRLTLCGRDPSAFITSSSLLPSRSERKAIMRPPGDHAGSKSCAGLVVRRRSLVPLALIVQMSSVLLEKVILPGRADTSIGALAREAGGAGWLLAGGAGPDPRP